MGFGENSGGFGRVKQNWGSSYEMLKLRVAMIGWFMRQLTVARTKITSSVGRLVTLVVI